MLLRCNQYFTFEHVVQSNAKKNKEKRLKIMQRACTFFFYRNNGFSSLVYTSQDVAQTQQNFAQSHHCTMADTECHFLDTIPILGKINLPQKVRNFWQYQIW